MTWQTVLSAVDAVESWMAAQSYWVQVPILLAVLLPLAWATAGVIDRVVEKLLRPRTRREVRSAAMAGVFVSPDVDGEDREGAPLPGRAVRPGGQR